MSSEPQSGIPGVSNSPPDTTPKAGAVPGDSVRQTPNVAPATQLEGVPPSSGNKLPGFMNANVDLSEPEFNSPGVAKLMYQEIVKLRGIIDLKAPFETGYYEQKEKVAVLEEQLFGDGADQLKEQRGKTKLIADIWFGAALCVAGGLICHADVVTDSWAKAGFFIGGVVLIGLGGVTRWAAK